MKTEKYVKLIFEKGSIIFRKVASYNIYDKVQSMIVTFEDKSASYVDMLFLNACLGKLINVKENISEVKELKCVDIIDTL